MLAQSQGTVGYAADSQWPVERITALVLEGLRGQRPITEICREVGIPTSRYYKWRDRFLKGGRNGLVEPEPQRVNLEQRIQELENENRHLKVEKEIFQSISVED